MKKLSLLLLTVTFFHFSCKSPVDIEQEISSVTVKGKLIDVFLEDTITVDPDLLLINDIPVNLNSEGEFKLDLPPGEYPIKVENEYHLPIDKTFTITESDSVLEIEMKSEMIDYYATDVGDKWTFDFSSVTNHLPFEPRSVFHGEMTWEIINSELNNATGDTVLTVEQILIGEKFTISFGDTTSKSEANSTHYFNIYLEPDGFIRYSEIHGFYFSWEGRGYGFYTLNEDDSEGTFTSFGDKIRGTRYFPMSRTEGKNIKILTSIGSGGCFVKINRGMGILNEWCTNIGNHGGGFHATLKKFESI